MIPQSGFFRVLFYFFNDVARELKAHLLDHKIKFRNIYIYITSFPFSQC